MPTTDQRRDAGRTLRKDVPGSSHAEWTPWSDRRDPIDVLEEQGRPGSRSWSRSGTGAWPSPPSRSSGAAPPSWRWISRPRRPPGCACRRAATPTSATSASSPRPSATSSSTSTTSTRPCPARGSGTSSGCAPASTSSPAATGSRRRAATRSCAPRSAPTASAWPSSPRCARSSSGTTASTSSRSSRTSRRSTGRSSSATCARPSARTTSGPSPSSPTTSTGELRFVEDPPLLVHLEDTDHDMDDVVPMIDALPRDASPTIARTLFDRFDVVDVARKVVGVGSVGTRCWVALLEGPDHRDGDRLDPADQGGAGLGARALRRRVVAGPPRAAGRRRPAAHPGGERHVPRLERRAAERAPLLRAPAVGRARARATSRRWTRATSPTTARSAPGRWPGLTPAPAMPCRSRLPRRLGPLRPGHGRVLRRLRRHQRAGPRRAHRGHRRRSRRGPARGLTGRPGIQGRSTQAPSTAGPVVSRPMDRPGTDSPRTRTA